ncbi:MAG: chorismate mutase [Lentisphaeria bacterium]|nr:chorismate mutase [Lentisphaeria bacterium]
MDASDLAKARCNIDRINAGIVALLIERMEQVDEVARYKAAHGLPVSDPEREKLILEKVSQLAGEEYAGDIVPVFQAVFAASCRREERKIKGQAHA